MMYLPVGYIYWSRIVTDINGDRMFCFRQTCGPQSLADADQVFSLYCGILLFGFEVRPDVLSWVARIGRCARVHLD